MRMQLTLLSYHYYNTLGFDPEFIDYINHINNSFLEDIIAPLYKKNGNGVNAYYGQPQSLSFTFSNEGFLTS